MADGKQLARRIFLRTMDELDVASSISRCVSYASGVLRCGDREYQLEQPADLRIVAVGKAAHGMLDGLITVMPPGIRFTGIVSAPTASLNPHPTLKYFVGGHPTPNQQSLDAGQAAQSLFRGCTAETLAIVLLS